MKWTSVMFSVSIRRKRTFIIEVNTFLLDLVGNSTYVLFSSHSKFLPFILFRDLQAFVRALLLWISSKVLFFILSYKTF